MTTELTRVFRVLAPRNKPPITVVRKEYCEKLLALIRTGSADHIRSVVES